MDTVFVKMGSSKSYMNLISSSAPVPLEKKKRKTERERRKKVFLEPIGRRQQLLGINNLETDTIQRSRKPELEHAGAAFAKPFQGNQPIEGDFKLSSYFCT